jgi:glycine/D-amino acid oxidase-like deaminating enzyme
VNAIVVGAGINGVTAAIELKNRGHRVTLVDPGPLPHPLAASTDISKAVRAAYGADEDYAELAERSIKIWRKWNHELPGSLFHEVGFLFLRRGKMQPGDFEYESFNLLQRHGHKVERVDVVQLRKHFPAWQNDIYQDGFVDLEGGYAESGRVVAALVERARSAGVELREGSRFAGLDENDGRVQGIVLQDRHRLAGDIVVMAVGAWTPYLLPFTKNFFRSTGHAVFHLRPSDPTLFAPERFPVFADDISSTGYYGFPLNQDGVVKVANHGLGREMSPDSPDRVVTPEDEQDLRAFLSLALPSLANAPIVYTGVCMYCDTHDGDFWIAPDPERQGLIVAAGDSGHGFKFAPVLGEIIADVAEGKANPLSKKFRWRPEIRPGERKEAARFRPEAL